MGMYTKINGTIDYIDSDYPDIIEHLLDILPRIGWSSSASRYDPESIPSFLMEMYNDENEYFHRQWWFTVDNDERKIALDGDIKNYEDQYQRTLAIIAKYLSPDCTANGQYKYEECDSWENWKIEKNILIWGGEQYRLKDLDFLRIPLPHPDGTPWIMWRKIKC